MGLLEELSSDYRRGSWSNTPILNSLLLWGGGLLALVLGLWFGGEGLLLALLGRSATAEVVGISNDGFRTRIRVVHFRFALPDGRTLQGAARDDRWETNPRTVEIRYLPFRPTWNGLAGGSRLFDVVKSLLISLSGVMVVALVARWQSFLDDGPPGS